MRLTTGAIFSVTVPATIMRSLWRGLGRKTSEPKRLFKECHGGVKRALSLRDGQRDLCGKARPDVIVGAHTEGVEPQRLFALARHRNYD